MPSYFQRRFTNEETFRNLRPDLFLGLLKQSEDFFVRHGLVLPADIQGLEGDAFKPGFDFDGLVRIFMEPSVDMPDHLIEGLHMVHEVASPRRYARMLREVEKHGLLAQLGPVRTPLDVAVFLWLHDPKGLEDLHGRMQVLRTRKYEYFLADVFPVPRFEHPTLHQRYELERQLGAYYAARGCASAVKVSIFEQQRRGTETVEWLFLVQHTEPARRQQTLQKGIPRPQLFVPWIHSRLKYDCGRGEMAVNASDEHETKILLKIFGRVLFGRDNFFPMQCKYDLLPVTRDGRAVTFCRDVPGIEHVSMTRVEFWDRETKEGMIHQAPDVFGLHERGLFKWPKELKQFKSATFAVKFWRQSVPRKVTIMPTNRALYSREEEGPLIEKLLEARQISRALAA